MAFKNGLSERLDELRFPSPRSPPSESSFPGYGPFPPNHSNLASAFPRPTGDVRSNIQRRFTTDSSKLSSWNYLNQGATQMPDPLDMLSSANHFYKSQLFEKKRQHIEYMREQRRRFEEDMKLLDLQHEREKREMDQLAQDLAKAGLSGPVSEPTTPPEYRDPGFSGAFSRPTRFSTSSVTSSPGFFNVFAPSHATSPSSQVNTASATTPTTSHFSVHSVPGSRRNSEKEDFGQESASPYRSSIHRYSLPSTGLPNQLRSSISSLNNPPSLEPFSTAKYLLHSDGDKSPPKDEDRIPTPDIRSYLKLTDPDDKFPTLSRRDDSGLLSANPDALDLANSRTPGPETYTHSRSRMAHQSMPQNALNMFRLNQLDSREGEDHHGSNAPRHAARHSIEANPHHGGDGANDHANRPASLQSSYSTNDLPTARDGNFDNAVTPPATPSESFHSGRRSQANGSPEHDHSRVSGPQGQQTTLQANAAPFGPHMGLANAAAPAGLPAFQPHFYEYGLQPYMGNQMQPQGQFQNYPPGGAYGAYPAYPNYRFENPARGAGARRNGDADPAQLARFANFPLQHYRGELYNLCKDQHGCRYLQRKLEEQNPRDVEMIYDEILIHVVDLMTDPFGNYLCQKLMEYSNDDQRMALMTSAAPQLVRIGLNQHGTRALQKMIEFISTPEQTQTVVRALENHVVQLVQDLNGNHVIQKCLNRLTAKDSQFIYDAIGRHCVAVGTHRHGCCVLQRCIDHASGDQRARLVAQITSHAFELVQDAFGNYVVQYILDLGEPHFTEPLCRKFQDNIPQLSRQKFSSNVIEKCLRTADQTTTRMMIDEMLQGSELERMLRDCFANYVVQTAMDFADPETHARIVSAVRPILPTIRQTPHGRRIAGKIVASEGSGRGSAATSGDVTPNEVNSAQLPGPLSAGHFAFPPNPFQSSNIGGQNFAPAPQANGNFAAQSQLFAYF